MPKLMKLPSKPKKIFKTKAAAKQYRATMKKHLHYNAEIKFMRYLKSKKLITDPYDYYSHWMGKVRLYRSKLNIMTNRIYRKAGIPKKKRKFYFYPVYCHRKISAMLLNTSRAWAYLRKVNQHVKSICNARLCAPPTTPKGDVR